MPVSTSSTAVEISWSLARNVRATSYTISYSNSNTDCFKDSNTITGIPGSATMYTLTGLQEGTEYSITVTAKMSNGVTFEHRILANTLPTGKNGPLFVPLHSIFPLSYFRSICSSQIFERYSSNKLQHYHSVGGSGLH